LKAFVTNREDVPSVGLRGNNVQNISAIHQLRKLMEDVEEIKSCSMWR
jgi:hypothetical protein